MSGHEGGGRNAAARGAGLVFAVITVAVATMGPGSTQLHVDAAARQTKVNQSEQGKGWYTMGGRVT